MGPVLGGAIPKGKIRDSQLLCEILFRRFGKDVADTQFAEGELIFKSFEVEPYRDLARCIGYFPEKCYICSILAYP